jgi:hypothetical protein
MLPEKLSDIITNMSNDELKEVAAVLESESDEVVWGEGSLYVADRYECFTWDGRNFTLHEHSETVISINEIF